MANSVEAFLGSGPAYPLVIENGAVKIVTGRELVSNDIYNLLSTNIGENFFLPERGCRLQELMFEPNDDVLIALATRFIFEAIDKWEKRVKFVNTEFEITDSDDSETTNSNDEDNGLVLITISFRILASNEVDSFIFPFYREIKF
jgi:phage baseplate assembly protein W